MTLKSNAEETSPHSSRDGRRGDVSTFSVIVVPLSHLKAARASQAISQK